RIAKLKAHLLSAAHLHEAAVKLDLGRYLLLGKGEEQSGGRAKRALLFDTLEALVAALYRDGGIGPVRQFVLQWVLGPIEWEQLSTGDFKSALQEWLQERHAAPPRYR